MFKKSPPDAKAEPPKRNYERIIKNLFAISGFHSVLEQHPGLKALEDLERENTLIELQQDIESLDLDKFNEKERIYLIDTAVKAGNLSAVKALAEKFISQKYDSDIRIPSKNNPEHPYRPVFWLAAIVTRQPGIPESNYQSIENYLCKKFKIPDKIIVAGKVWTRQTYIDAVNTWKEQKNAELASNGASKPRYKKS